MDNSIRDKITTFFDKNMSHTVPKGTLITLAGEDPKEITYLVDGVVEQYHITPQGNKVVVNVFKPPAFFPMSWAINGTPNIYFYETITQATIKYSEPTKTVEFLKNNPDVSFDLLSRVYRGTDALLRRIVIAASGVAINRLVFELLIEAYRFGKERDNNQREIFIKQSILASHSGLARETVSRELRKLANDEYLVFTKHGFLLNINKLEALLDISI
jgi:CRP-like cAMP-binding protein